MFPSFRAPETMTAAEQARLLRVTAAHKDPRDQVLYSMAPGMGLGLRELQLPSIEQQERLREHRVSGTSLSRIAPQYFHQALILPASLIHAECP
jgi:hypothetical protein